MFCNVFVLYFTLCVCIYIYIYMYSFIYIFKPTYYTATKLSAEPEVICHPSIPAKKYQKTKQNKNKCFLCVFHLFFSQPEAHGFRVEGFRVEGLSFRVEGLGFNEPDAPKSRDFPRPRTKPSARITLGPGLLRLNPNLC